MTDYMATPGMIANSLRPIVLAHGDGTPPETLTVPTGTLTAAYMHLETLAALFGEATVGGGEWMMRGNPVETWEAERVVLERAIERMGWPEIKAFHARLSGGQGVFEDAGGFFLRCIKALFRIGTDDIFTYRQAARDLVKHADERLARRRPIGEGLCSK